MLLVIALLTASGSSSTDEAHDQPQAMGSYGGRGRHIHPPAIDPPSSAIPPISNEPASLPIHQTSQLADFRFECSLGRPIVTTFIIVTL